MYIPISNSPYIPPECRSLLVHQVSATPRASPLPTAPPNWVPRRLDSSTHPRYT